MPLFLSIQAQGPVKPTFSEACVPFGLDIIDVCVQVIELGVDDLHDRQVSLFIFFHRQPLALLGLLEGTPRQADLLERLGVGVVGGFRLQTDIVLDFAVVLRGHADAVFAGASRISPFAPFEDWDAASG